MISLILNMFMKAMQLLIYIYLLNMLRLVHKFRMVRLVTLKIVPWLSKMMMGKGSTVLFYSIIHCYLKTFLPNKTATTVFFKKFFFDGGFWTLRGLVD